MTCAETTPTDGSAWVALAGCLEAEGLPEAAARAWRHAWEADPALADQVLAAALRFAHQSGDDALVVEVAASMPSVADPDAAGHLIWARALQGADDERSVLESVPAEACRYPHARYRLAASWVAEGKLKSAVMSLRTVVEWDRDLAGWGPGPTGELWSLADLAMLQVAWVYGSIDRPDNARGYATQIVRRRDPTTAYPLTVLAWADLETDALEEARRGAEQAEAALPEASAIAVAALDDPLARVHAAAEAHARWAGVRQELVDFVATRGDDPPRQAVNHLDLSDDAIRAAGAMGPLSTLWLRSYDLDREARRTRRSPVAGALVAEAREALDNRFSAALLHVASAGIERIDRSLLAVDGAIHGEVPPPSWRAEDLGWFLP